MTDSIVDGLLTAGHAMQACARQLKQLSDTGISYTREARRILEATTNADPPRKADREHQVSAAPPPSVH